MLIKRYALCVILTVVLGWQLNQYFNAGQAHPIRIACVGDSITAGSGVLDKDHDSYPAQLSAMLGDAWEVKNFGANDTSVLKSGKKPYMKKRAFKLAYRFKPDVIIISLGTNDARQENWAHKTDFVKDYIDLIRTFQQMSSHPKIFICYPPPALPNEYGINDAVIKNEVLPLITEVVKQTGLTSIDLYAAMGHTPELFFDDIHPNKQGYALIAAQAYQAITADAHPITDPHSASQ